ncbi:hypothetical protein VPNG_04438 [Cytospora leucostoma]|uniref:DASH complex subunit DUO1 n=1 Tax=Cytospora leucostoma TaxID=1230097 RepID=A0A423XBX7_9PEZI|nr:hypothetical protein VPNG_04438 [Cytospora leucostoma]
MADKRDLSEVFSPIKPLEFPDRPKTPKTPTPSNQKDKEPFDAEEVRDAQLRRELEGVRNVNEVIEGVIGTLERAKGNMGSVSQTVNNASTLLNTWTRILSQTEHNQRLILNPNWKGATQDLHDIEAEAIAQQQAAERRAAEAERRREEARRKAEDQERVRMAGISSTAGRGSGTRGVRGTRASRGRGILRGGTRSTATASGHAPTNSSGIGTRSSSQIGRGFGASRTTRGTRGAGRGAS